MIVNGEALTDAHQRLQKTYWMRLILYFCMSLSGFGRKACYVAIQVFRIVDLEYHLS